jgi:hypothetical protein
MDQRDLYKIMAKYSWSDIHYANSFLPDDEPKHDNPNCWRVGLWSGPNKDTVCVREAHTEAELVRYRSPAGSTINDAFTKAKILWMDTMPGAEPRASCRRRQLIVSPL